MVFALYITGTKFSGKTALCLGLYNNLNERGIRVGYFKPVGQGQKTVNGKIQDPDVVLMKEVLELSESLSELCPVVLGSRYLDVSSKSAELINSVDTAFDKVKVDKDIIIIEAGQIPELLSCYSLDSASLARKFNAKVIFSVKGDTDTCADKTLLYKNYFCSMDVDFIGTVINFVPFYQLERMKGVISNTLGKCGVNVLGIVPDHRELTLPIVQDVADELNAEILAGKGNLDKTVDNYLIGAMSPESALSWLRRSVDRAFITGGDRTDLILTALETKPSAIILTGNIYPSTQVISTAESKNVPLLLVLDDTYTTVTKLEHLSGRIVPNPKSSKKIQLTKKIMNEYIDWGKILDEFVIWKLNNK